MDDFQQVQPRFPKDPAAQEPAERRIDLLKVSGLVRGSHAKGGVFEEAAEKFGLFVGQTVGAVELAELAQCEKGADSCFPNPIRPFRREKIKKEVLLLGSATDQVRDSPGTGVIGSRLRKRRGVVENIPQEDIAGIGFGKIEEGGKSGIAAENPSFRIEIEKRERKRLQVLPWGGCHSVGDPRGHPIHFKTS
jgi:hypothetical protein